MKNHTHGNNRFARSRGAFTLIELMVAIAITAVMLLAVNTIFTTASDAIGTGTGASDIIANARAINDQLTRDGEEMVGPRENGFLVILQREIVDDGSGNTDGVPIIEGDLDSGYRSIVRSDQLVFIRDARDIEPLAPGNTSSYSNGADAQYARVWFGHPLRTEPDGLSVPPPGFLGRLNGGAPTVNTLAADWTLGRQALFLSGGAGVSAPSGVFVDGAQWDHPISGYGSDGGDLFWGQSDVSNRELYSTVAGEAIIGPTTGTNPLYDGMPSNSYATEAYNYTYGYQRLLVNPTPALPADPSADPVFESHMIAQMHPYFGGHVSDIVVEFAGDYDGVRGIDVNSTAISDVDDEGVNYNYPAGNIKWYTHNNFANEPGTADYLTRKAATWPIQGTTGFNAGGTTPIYNSAPPPQLQHADATFVWRHDDDMAAPPPPTVIPVEASKWPHLIRVRYRLHDAEGNVIGADDNPGKWFEVIIPVNRP